MPGAARLGDKAQVAADAHGCPACPHPAVGPIVTGSPDVLVNGKPAARLDDLGIHAACCGPNNFQIAKGSPTVYVNGKPLARMQDQANHCGGKGPIIEGSQDVLIDDGAAAASGLGRSVVRGVQIVVQQGRAAKKHKAVSGRDRNPGNTGAASGAGAYTVPVRTPAPAPAKSGSPQPQKPAAQAVARLVDPTGVPVAGWAYRLTLPDGTVRTGESDGQGYIREDAGDQEGDAHLVLVGELPKA